MAGAALVFAFVALLGAVGALADAGSGAFLLLHKEVQIKRLKPGSERITVSLVVHNAGSTTAYDVSLIDDSWPSSYFNVVSGDTSTAWEKLEVGKSLQHSFVLEPKTKGSFQAAPAVVKYRVAAKSALQEAWSTPLPPLDTLSDKPSGIKYDFIKNIALKYGPLVSVLSIVGIFVYLMVAPSSSKKPKSKKRR
ncbi:translocon-associated protein subunit beta [Selaginella moellendorffii]|uniref:translocon-associated protein subunit beta n=1 Tax=Selaginella moellendorffii TaxID=88036 RepID=UPI000D1C5D7E|nr:translocon-associated protein subunit beta [Selaginella moellendorffii]|eukprot:XP_024539812.1 translocon-associated protein subunit beta [Selaginella moellendorffii]